MSQFGERDVTFDEVKSHLEKDAASLFSLPDYAQVARNLVSMANFLPLIEPVINEISPQKICEIGAYRGISTRALASIATLHKGQLFVVDPAIDPKNPPVDGEHIQYFQMLSEEFLATPRNVGIYFIDGDHNYEVVSRELALVVEQQSSPVFPILFMHDTGWPCGYRDMYYDVTRVSAVHHLGCDPVIPLTVPNPDGVEITLPRDVDFADTAGGPRNGVRTAVLDFLETQPDWRFINLPSLYGLGVLWHANSVSQAISKRLDDLKLLFDQIGSFVSILEFNRILLLSELNLQGKIWKENQAYIRELAGRIENLQRGKGGLKQVIKRLFGRS